MRKFLLLSLTSCLSFAACADHAGSLLANKSGPQAPINNPDTGAFQPTNGGGSTAGSGAAAGSGTNDTGTGSNAGTEGGGGTQGSGTGDTGQGVAGGESGGPGGPPVPEPSTLLLVGTGLAGAALLRRRRKAAPASDA